MSVSYPALFQYQNGQFFCFYMVTKSVSVIVNFLTMNRIQLDIKD